MVLKSIQLVSFFLGLVLVGENGPLLKQYHKKLQKDVEKLFDQKNSEITFVNLGSADESIEQYALNVAQKSIGFLFIKEVRACNLNGCTMDNLLTNNLGSEYYDIAVMTNENRKIMKVKVLDYFSDYGYEIASKRYLKRFQDKNLCDFSKASPQVDGISGATISYNALITSMEDFCNTQTE